MGINRRTTAILALGICGLVAMPAFAAPAPWKLNETVRGAEKTGAPGYEQVIPQSELVNPKTSDPAPIQLAQSSDAAFRINQLEEQIRLLNGKVEDMTFQMLQMQEQMRKMQEDNEFRFQELEQRGDISTGGGESLGKSQPSDQSGSGNESDGNRKSISDLLEGEDFSSNQQLGAPPTQLGTLTFDADGNLVDSNIGKPIDLTGDRSAVDLPQQADQLFNLGYEYVQAGDYAQAQIVFDEFVASHPEDPKIPEAKFWLGESLFAQGQYESAARVFLENHKQNPNGALAAQNLLKLGVSLAGLDQRELACATYAEVPKKYPNMSNSVRKRVDVEQRSAKCKNS